jgi:predicted nuclease of predicted toxin-antitoxin system
MKILIDMNLSPTWVAAFLVAEIESVHWSTVGDQATADRLIMAYAKANGYIVFTNNLDFGTLLAVTKADLPSVIQVRTQDLLPAVISDLVISALSQYQSQLEAGALVTIDTLRSRVKILPIN